MKIDNYNVLSRLCFGKTRHFFISDEVDPQNIKQSHHGSNETDREKEYRWKSPTQAVSHESS